jgi:hypothetical protein
MPVVKRFFDFFLFLLHLSVRVLTTPHNSITGLNHSSKTAGCTEQLLSGQQVVPVSLREFDSGKKKKALCFTDPDTAFFGIEAIP